MAHEVSCFLVFVCSKYVIIFILLVGREMLMAITEVSRKVGI